MAKVLVIGGGGREHALAWKLARDEARPQLFCAPGNAGTAGQALNVPIGAEDIDGLCAWARAERPDLVVVGPEAPLCAGVVDALATDGIRVFGPTRDAARLEGSKAFAKDIMLAAGVPTASSESCSTLEAAYRAIKRSAEPLVVKADGLAAGKGVFVCATRAEACAAAESILAQRRFGAAGDNLLIEQFLEGPEVSILALCDGRQAYPLPAAQDHKRVGEGDTGPNTGGMGAYSPTPAVDDALCDAIQARIFVPLLDELRRRGITYRGVLYAGLILTPEGPKVLEFNCRFGDPETQVIMPLLDCDLLPLLEGCAIGRLETRRIPVRNESCVTVVMASGGYPGDYRKGLPIKGLETAAAHPDVQVFHAGTERREGRVFTAGGRVLDVTAWNKSLRGALDTVYAATASINFEGAFYRRDIAHRALNTTTETGS